jgi:hypothetical protein
MPKKRPFVAYFDEHIHPSVINAFKDQGYKCILISKTRQYAGVDERKYIQHIRAEGAFFVTGDIEFIEDVIQQKIKHAGIILIPTRWEDDVLGFAAAGIAGCVLGIIDWKGRRSLYNMIFSIEEDGFHITEKGINKLDYSIDQFTLDINQYVQSGGIVP